MATITTIRPDTGGLPTTNLFTNPSFEGNGAWSVTGNDTTVTQGTFGVLAGVYNAIIDVDSTPSSGFNGVSQDVDNVLPGQWLAVRIPVKPEGTSGRTYVEAARLRILWLDSDGLVISSNTLSRTALDPFAYNYLTYSAQAPSGTTSARVALYFASIASDVPVPNSSARTDAWMAVAAGTQAAALTAVETYSDSGLVYIIEPLLILDYGFTRGSRNVILEPLGSAYPTVFLRGAQSRSGTLTMLFGSADAANSADAALSGIGRFHFEEPEAGQDFHFIKSGNLTVRNVPGTSAWTVAVDFREVEAL